MADGHIHKHLQSMFHLLRNEETLKMAVKLESARYGRTRYLVVVSCSRKDIKRKLTQSHQQQQQQQQQQHFNNLINAQNINSSTKGISSNNRNSNENQNSNSSTTPSPNRKSSPDQLPNSSPALIATSLKSGTKHLINEKDLTNLNRLSTSPKQEQQQQQQPLPPQQQQTDQLDEMNQNNMNEVEESCLLGIDCNEKTTVGLVLRILGDTTIRLDGDGGFCISGSGRTHIFKPVSVQAMWSALQTLHKVCAKARGNNLYPGRPSHEWVSYYDERIGSDQSCLNEWNAMDSLETRRPPSPDAIRTKPTEREETEKVIRTTLKEIIVQLDLDEVTSKFIRTKVEEHLDMNLTEYKSFIDEEMLKILKQLDAPTKIFDHVYLGSEWNASNLEELQKNGVRHIVNVTREIDNFFPGMFDYFNVRVYDDDKTNLLKYWDNTYKYISQAKNSGSNVLVHCKMGISRSASVVIAYAMKAYGWSFTEAIDHVRNNRNCIKPNKNFLNQLETYQGMLMAMKNKEKLQRSKSDTNLRSVKDARLLPGSEPTPLIQAFNAAAKKQSQNSFLMRSATLSNRPKSWSPDSLECAVLLPKQHSQSLEYLAPEWNEKVKLKNNMRLPCKNGQNYSVSQNQVFYLEEANVMQQCMSNVKLIVNELESNVKRRTEGKQTVEGKTMNKDSDSSNQNVTLRVVTKPPISTTSTCDRTSPFGSLKRSESNKSRSDYDGQSEKYSPVMKSRSLDVSNMVTSTATTAINVPPSTINNRPPYGSPNNRHSLHEETMSNTSSNPNVSPAWTRRFYNPTNSTANNNNNNSNNINSNSNNNNNNNNNNSSSRSGSSSSNSSNSSNSSSSSNVSSLASMSTDLINDLCKTGSKNVKNLRNAYSLKSTNQNINSNKTVGMMPTYAAVDKRNLFNDSDTESSFVNMTIARLADQFSKDIMQRIKKRCKSDGMLYESDLLATVNKRFSSSSPTDYSEKPLNNRSAITWNNRLANNNKNNIQIKGKRNVKNRGSLCRTVENLKLNFESKETDASSNIGIAKEAKRGKSLPSSPVASVYANNMSMTTTTTTMATAPTTVESTPTTLKLNYDKLGCEEINVKGLVDKYEVTKLKNETNTNATAAAAAATFNASTPNVIARFKRHTIHQSPQHNTIHPKPPPIPHASIVVASKPANILLSKQPLHQNNNQSFARLKEHFNSASAYNTM